MTTPFVMTPPQELFCELTDLGSLMFGMLAGPRVIVRRWPAYYMIYLETDRLCQDLSRITGYLCRGFTQPDGRTDAPGIDAANACLAGIDRHFRSVVDLLARMELRGLVSHDRPALGAIVRSHFAQDSPWYQACRARYMSGRVSADCLLLQRTALVPDRSAACGPPDPDGGNLIRQQTFSLESARSRILLGQSARQVQVRLNQVYAALGEFFASHCPRVTELLHPSMT